MFTSNETKGVFYEAICYFVDRTEERLRRFGQNDHKRVFGMKADKFLTEAGFDVETIRGEDYSDEILPVVGPADYDMNILFCCRKPE